MLCSENIGLYIIKAVCVDVSMGKRLKLFLVWVTDNLLQSYNLLKGLKDLLIQNHKTKSHLIQQVVSVVFKQKWHKQLLVSPQQQTLSLMLFSNITMTLTSDYGPVVPCGTNWE